MCNCTYCDDSYRPRPQVKNPKACPKLSCQKARQRDNEKAWHERNRSRFDADYHRRRRKQRLKAIRAILDRIADCLRKGGTLLGFGLESAEIGPVLLEFLQGLGIRRINKLWNT